MFNIVARVAGIAVLGGVGLFAVYSMSDEGTADNAVREPASEQSLSGDVEGYASPPEGTAPLVFAEGQEGERVQTDPEDDLFSTGEFAQEEDDQAEDEAEGLARLGEGGVLDELPSTDTDETAVARPVAQATPADADSEPDQASGRGLRGFPTAPADTAAAPQPTDEPSASPALEQNTPGQTTDMAVQDTADHTTSEAQTRTTMIRNPVRRDKPDAPMTRNAARKDKPDDGTHFTANRKRVDKPDDGDYFTENTTRSDFAPCLKADGTPYVGPGTAVNPFADVNPCLPQATAQDFAVAPPQVTTSDVVTLTRTFGLPPERDYYGSQTPLPPGPGGGSDYSAI
jgi:hypothetical protein